MKKVLIVLFCCLFGIGTAWSNEPDFVVTNGEVHFVESLRVSFLFGFSWNTDEGRVRLKATEVDSYRKNGIVYYKVPVIVNGRETGRKQFMEAISMRNGQVVCRQLTAMRVGEKAELLNVYNVDRDNSYDLTITSKNVETLSQYFSRQ